MEANSSDVHDVSRAQAASYHEAESIVPGTQQQESAHTCDAAVLYRLKRLEEHVGLSNIDIEDQATTVQGQDDALNQYPEDLTLDPLQPAIHLLRSSCSTDTDPKIWKGSLIKRLWLTYGFP